MGTFKSALVVAGCFCGICGARSVGVARTFFHEGVVRDRIVLYLNMPFDQVVVSQPSPTALVVRLPGCLCANDGVCNDFKHLSRKRIGYVVDAKQSENGLTLAIDFDPQSVGVFVHRMDSIGMVPALSITFVRYQAQTPGGVGHHKPVIAIDCGHGGWETGAVGFGLVEKNLTLTVGTMLGTCLRGRGYEVIYTRSGDIFVPLDRRTSAVNGMCDFLISIHHNSSGKSQDTARGVETWLFNPAQVGLIYHTDNVPEQAFSDAKTTRLSERAARIVHEQLVRTPGLKLVDRGIKNAFSQILLAETPALLVELLFINNAQDAAILRSSDNLSAFARQLCEGIDRYMATVAS